MLLSMTGYGRATLSEGPKTYAAELRGLNSKQTDLRLRSNQALQQHELELRTLVLDAVKRGKLELTLEITDASTASKLRVDLPLLAELSTNIYFNLKASLPDSSMDGLVPALLRTPGIIEASTGTVEEQDWQHIQAVTRDCLTRFQDYRRQEGLTLAEDLSTRVRAIVDLLARVSDFDTQRIEAVRERMERHLKDYVGRANVDQNRYEQEVLFYLEKMDIHEEQVRLQQNCEYFREILDNEDDIKGRKLNFISQEMGREINTLGAKAYSADLQKLVVNMKEHLEMIKEQLANVA
ncbi:hypothetical protein LEM8419_01063 [Neolewinella maritima]|uniref:YicC family protein n=1 Tax=Neolewinella maritima TaxID=1383882 RepID=A0ABM9AZ61_9BACT|nr:YicC/YloC family endoribonuclease [Neolewinella maritima]CAH0999763.1 hypothetical protein LEM8419_01063 [Neolewinella maritima]